MYRLLTVGFAVTVLSACSSEGIDRRADLTPEPQDDASQSANVVVLNGTDTVDDTATTTEGDSSNTTTIDVDNAEGSETVTVDAAETTEPAVPDTTDTTGQISDDAGSSTSDGGQISDDAGSATSDGGQISDNAGSATSDGGQISDDAASSSSDGGLVADDPVDNTVTDNTTQGPVDTDAGSFSSDSTGGDVIRRSSLSSTGTENICTTASNPNDFSDSQVGDFILHNNAWRTFRAAPGYEWSQCIKTNQNGALAGWSYDWGPGISGLNGNPSPSGDYYVRSYPELIYGVKDEFRTSAPQSETGLPVRLGEMPNIQIDYSYDAPQYGQPRVVDASNNSRFPNGTTISGERNVAIESFLYNPDASGQCTPGIVTRNGGSNHTYEIMVWLDAGAERLPAGPDDFVADLTIRDNPYKVYTKGSDNRYIAFVAQNPQTSGTIYWNDFTDWARENGHLVRERFGALSNTVEIQDYWCVANILVGTEIFWGAGNVDIFDWTITQSR